MWIRNLTPSGDDVNSAIPEEVTEEDADLGIRHEVSSSEPWQGE